MAGPGGGPSRRSHTKSRKGCKTCKRRHIRCDETFPQCRNCTKHQCRCDYMDSPTVTGEDSPNSPSQPNLLWTPEIERIVELWRQTGEYPFPELGVYPQPQWHLYSKSELRLIHHLSSIASEMHRSRTSRLTIWTEFLPRFLSIAASQPFVMHSILAFSASHLAWISQSNETRRLALHFSSEAFRGLQQAMNNFSKANADAVLAASLILSWQATEWRGWNSIITGKKAIVAAMQPWRRESLFADYLARQDLGAQPSLANERSHHMTPEARQEHLTILQHVQSSLVGLQPYLINREQENKWIDQLKGYIERLRTSNPPRTPEEQFGQLYPLRKWLFWIPVSLLATRKGDVFTLIVLANFYATALAIEPLFPDIGASFCANMALPPLEEIVRITNQLHSIQGYNQATQAAIMLMKSPQETASNFHSRREWARQHAENLQAISSVSYGLDGLNLDLETPFSEFGYGQSLSPAFPPSPLHMSPTNSAIPAPGSGSPYLKVPRSSVDYSGGSSAYATPLSSPAAPPLAYTQEESFFNYGVSSFGYHPGGFVASQPIWT